MIVESLLRRATAPLFERLEVDPAWVRALEDAAARGPVVHVLRHASTLDFLALDHLARRHGLPELSFANELPTVVRPRAGRDGDEAAALVRTLRRGDSAVLFLQRAPSRPGGLPGKREGSELLAALLDLARQRPDVPLTLVPQLFVWTRRSERRGFSLVDSLLGPADFPGELRQLGQILGNLSRGELRSGEAVSIGEFLDANRNETGEALARRLGYALLRKLDRERRTIVGPARKPADRVREEVLRSPKLQAVLRELAGPTPAAQEELAASARGMLDELMTVPDPQAAKAMEALAKALLERVYSGIDVDEEGIERIREAARDGSVVLLPSHKSHVDYVVLSWVLRQRSLQLPVIAAGDNLSFFPLGPLLRRGGAFFIRRSFRGDRLYAAVVDAYVRRLLREGWMIEFFMEGGRSRTGKLLPPMLGLLSMVVSAALPLERRKVSFFPVSIGYERLMEERAFARELSGGAKPREDARQLLAATKVLTDRWGRVNIQVGRAVELGALRAELGLGSEPSPAKRRELVKRLAHRVMSEINRVTAVTPGSLVALVLLGRGRRGGMAYREVVDGCVRLARLLRGLGARLAPSLLPAGTDRLREQGVVEALRLYVRSGLVAQHVPGELGDDGTRRQRLYTGTDVIFSVPEDKRVRLDFAKNHILPFLVDRALVATALLSREAGRATVGEIRERVQSLSRLFKFEFMFRADASFERIFDETLHAMLESGELSGTPDALGAGPGHDGLDGQGWLRFHAAALCNVVEGYRVAARGLEALVGGAIAKKELVSRALKTGQRMVLKGEIERAEAVERPLLENALEAFVDQGYLVREGEGYALTPSFASEHGVRAVEARVAAFLPRLAD